MQVADYQDWVERSLVYLCRAFDQPVRGGAYLDIKETIHISILAFTLFPECPEFYAKYEMMNVKNHHVYSDKFRLYVLDLSQTELATEEDRVSILASGMRQGMALGIEQGIKLEAERYSALTRLLIEEKRYEELKKIAEDEEYRKASYKKYHIE